MAVDFVRELSLHLKARYPLIFVLSKEEDRALAAIRKAAGALEREVLRPRRAGDTTELGELLAASGDPRTVLVLDDVHRRLDDPDAGRLLADLAPLEPLEG